MNGAKTGLMAAMLVMVVALNAAAHNFSGKYVADGEGVGGKPYKAMVEVTKEGDAYNVTWQLSGTESYTGIGLVEGENLSVGWSSGQTSGLIIYKPDGDKLVGRWTAPGLKGKVFKETLTPVK